MVSLQKVMAHWDSCLLRKVFHGHILITGSNQQWNSVKLEFFKDEGQIPQKVFQIHYDNDIHIIRCFLFERANASRFSNH